MPSWQCVTEWLRANPEFGEQYARAREASADAFEAEIIERSRNSTAETVAADRLLADSLKWAAGRRSSNRESDAVSIQVVVRRIVDGET